MYNCYLISQLAKRSFFRLVANCRKKALGDNVAAACESKEKSKNEYKKYVDILTEENLSSIYLANMNLIYWSVRSSCKRGGDTINGC